MSPFADQDHYEILEAARAATPEQIERAYRLARATWESDSLAGYSILDEDQAAVLRERVEAAYRVLSDAAARRAYDASLERSESRRRAMPRSAPVDAFEEIDDESGDFDGARLRRVRLRRGLELDQIAEVTKISPLYLRFIEEERFADLPARVYVRGFVCSYAAAVGLEEQRVASSYMERYEARQAEPRGRRRER